MCAHKNEGLGLITHAELIGAGLVVCVPEHAHAH